MTMLTPESLRIDFPGLESIFSQDVYSIVENILLRLVESKKFLSAFKVKRVKFRYHQNSTKSHSAVFKILQRNAENLISLEIDTIKFACESALTFSNLQNLFIRIPFIENFKASFLLHSSYKSIDLCPNLKIEMISGKEYFTLHNAFTETATDISSLIDLLKKSKKLVHLSFNLLFPFKSLSDISTSQLDDFKLSVRSLKI